MVTTLCSGWPKFDDGFLHQRRGRTGLHAGPAGDAFAGQERLVHAGGDLGFEAAALDRQCERALHLGAGTDAAGADDAFRRVELEIGVRAVDRCGEVIGTLIAITHLAQPNFAGGRLQLAIAVGGAGEAIERMIGDIQLHHAAAQAAQLVGHGMHRHPGRHRRRTRRRRPRSAFDLDQAETTASEAVQAVGRAEFRNLDPGLHRGAHDGCAGRHGNRLTVDGEGDRIRRDRVSDRRRPVIDILQQRHVTLLLRSVPAWVPPKILREMFERAHHRIWDEPAQSTE